MKNFIFTVLFLILTFTFLLSMWTESYMWASISATLLGILYIVVSNYINDQLEK
jgi:accessory gene regulator protein AgrB